MPAMKMSNKLRRELERSLRCLNEGLTTLKQPGTLGVAREKPADRCNGSDYDLRNVKCMETTSGLSPHISVSPVVGSKLVMAFTARDILTQLLED